MSRDIAVIDPELIEGEIVAETVVLDGDDMCSMNFARLEHQRLDRLIRTIVIPMIGGYQTELGEALDRHLEQVTTFSRNFCWKHRHVGSAWGEVGKRPGVDD
jgi:hypothetical protein